jgi:hypothetical protein
LIETDTAVTNEFLLSDEGINAVFSVFDATHAFQSLLKLFGDRTGHLGVVASELGGGGLSICDHHPVLTEGVKMDLDPDVFRPFDLQRVQGIHHASKLVDKAGVEPATFRMRSGRSPN